MRQLSALVLLVMMPVGLVPRWGLAQEQADDAAGGAQAAPATPGVGELTEPSSELRTGLDFGVGFARIDEDYFLDFNAAVIFSILKFEFGLQVPLRMRIIDEDPEDDDFIRKEDWDEVSEYFRIIRYAQYGDRNDPYFVRAGELGGVVLGHGTIVNGYNNVVDINHFQWGIEGAVNTRSGGVEALFDNIASPEVMGLRAYVRPWSFVDPESYWTRLAFGMSLVGDRDAPRRLLLAPDGRYVVDDEHNLVVAERDATAVLGVDVELQAYTSERISITPYSDVNFHLGVGSGFHLGTFAAFTLHELFALNTQLEFRAAGEGYVPEYFDGLYEVEKFLFRPHPDDPTSQLRPKLFIVDTVPPEAVVGTFLSGTFQILKVVLVTLAYEDYQGDNNSSFMARLLLPEVGPVRLGAYFINQNFDGADELFDLDDSLLVAEARVFLTGPLYVIGQFARRFAAQPDGSYESVDDWAFGAGVAFGL